MPNQTTSRRATIRQDDPESLEARWGVRKIIVQRAQTFVDGGHEIPSPRNQVTAAAIIKNPWIGQSIDNDLLVEPQRIAARLSKLLSDRLIEVLGGVGNVEAFGKGAIIGEDGELEHGAALIHTPYFASHLRQFLEGSAVISFADTRGPAGEPLTVPLCEKHTGVKRDHYQSVRVQIADAPQADEVVVVAAAADGGRPFPRIGDRTTDLPLDVSNMNGVFA